MAEFTYNNAKNTNIGHISYEFNYKYYFRNFDKKDFHLCSK